MISYWSIGIVSGVLLALQLVLMQALAFAQGHHLAYVVLSVALLGFGAGGSVLVLWRNFSARHAGRLYGPALIACGLFTASLPFPSQHLLQGLEVDLLFTGWRPWVGLCAMGMLMLLPFFAGALALSIAMRARAGDIARVYACNLAGSALGVLLALLLLRVLQPEVLLPVLGLCALAAGATARVRVKTLFPATVCVVAAWLLVPAWPISPYKALSYARQMPEREESGPYAHPLGRVDVVVAPALRYAPDLSLQYRGAVPSPAQIFVNGDANGVLLPSSDPAARILEETPQGLPYAVGTYSQVLLLDPAGSAPVWPALAQADSVTVVEPHPRIARLLEPLLPADVTLKQADPRRFLSGGGHDPYDLILFPQRGIFGGPSGLQTLGEDTLFTVEAVRRAFSLLSPQGRVVFPVWLDEPLRYAMRVTDLVAEALRAEGVRDVQDHVVIVRGWGSVVLLASRATITKEEQTAIAAFVQARGFDLLHPDRGARRLHGAADEAPYEALVGLLGPHANAIRTQYRFDIRAPIDRRPFLHQFLHWHDRGDDLSGLSVSERGLTVLRILLVLLTGAALGLVLLPLWPLRRSVVRKPLTILYFGGLGAGFMLYEVALMQQLVPLLGNPITATAVVITGLLAGMTAGSLLSMRLVHQGGLAYYPALAASMLLLLGLVVPSIIQGMLPLPAIFKWPPLLLLLVVPAILLGIPFPLGIRYLSGRDADQIPWACGIDGAVSVLAAPTAALFAFFWGYPTVVYVAAGAYVLSAIAAYGMRS